MSEYTTRQGDTWDSITYELTGDTVLTGMLMEANPQYADVYIFSAGIILTVPEWDSTELDTSSYPPWKRGED